MLKFIKIKIDGKPRVCIVKSDIYLPRYIEIKESELIKTGSSKFYIYDGKFLFKVRENKYKIKRNPIGWFFRTLIRDRILIQTDSRKEYKGNKRIERVGIKTVRNYGWGVFINPFDRYLSLCFMSYHPEMVELQEFLNDKNKSKENKNHVIENLLDEINYLAGRGYYLKDFHFGNFLYGDNDLLWIDTHIKPLSKFKNKKGDQFTSSIDKRKVGDQYWDMVKSVIQPIS
ncbi:hypothetical protein [Dongshaea marina]|uniref:hypothetical protein n=1 Tax=Dongshaea marina TaxID=2047966 RepID=UPI000D3E8D76|nr:hypothetical protein [Dongshaea marina]